MHNAHWDECMKQSWDDKGPLSSTAAGDRDELSRLQCCKQPGCQGHPSPLGPCYPKGVGGNMDLMDMGGHDNLAICNIAVLNGVNEQLTAAKRRVHHFDAHDLNLWCSVCAPVCLCMCLSACLLSAVRGHLGRFVTVLSLTRLANSFEHTAGIVWPSLV